MGNTPNQGNYQTSQNFKIDIEQIYSDFIQEIDENRSVVNVNLPIDIGSLSSFDAKTLAGINKSIRIENTPQESRLHCFLRLVGFPVIDSAQARYYNPGFDIIGGPKQISYDEKIDIANHPIAGFKEFSIKRENYINTIKKVWEKQPFTITASALALTSSNNIRPFSSPLVDSDESFKDFDKQGYKIDLTTTIGQFNNIKLTDYIDSAGNKPNESDLLPQRYHYIRPFIVDARIDFTCNPSSRKVAVPFVPNKTKLLVSENTFVKRPLIEKVIRERFGSNNQKDISSSQQNIKDVILSIPTITDEKIIQRMGNDVYALNDKIQFQKYLFIIAAMCKELVQAQITIQSVKSTYYWVPVPPINGPEGGCDVNGIIISDKLPDGDNYSFITVADRDLINASLQQASNNFNALTTDTNSIPDRIFALDNNLKGDFNDDTTPALGNQVTDQIANITRIRNHDIGAGNAALRTIEIIMGEWSGLGLCDIIAVMGALYTMPKENLLGFLDTDAFLRMITELDLDGLSNPGIVDAHTKFTAKVKDFYNLMDDIYKQISKNNSLGS